MWSLVPLVGAITLVIGSPGFDRSPVAAAASDGFVSTTPTRVLDTRGGDGPIDAGDTVTAPLTGVPADAAAVVVNVTAANATGDGYFSVWNCDGPAPTTSNGN
jgi:hypothetical protein